MDTDEDEFDMGKFAPPQVYRRPYTRDDFEIMRTVGRGTFGSVFIVYRKDDPEQTRMAMKVISKAVVRQKVFTVSRLFDRFMHVSARDGAYPE